jgi:hypothetical protein
VEQKPVLDSSGKAQMHPVLQGLLALQPPPQERFVASLRNCRAESVPTPRTAAIIAASNMFLIVCLLMIHSPLFDGSFVKNNLGRIRSKDQPSSWILARIAVPEREWK